MKKFLSRKLATTVGTAASLVGAGQYKAAAAVVIAYLIAQGYVDAKTASQVLTEVEQGAKVVTDVVHAVEDAQPAA